MGVGWGGVGLREVQWSGAGRGAASAPPRAVRTHRLLSLLCLPCPLRPALPCPAGAHRQGCRGRCRGQVPGEPLHCRALYCPVLPCPALPCVREMSFARLAACMRVCHRQARPGLAVWIGLGGGGDHPVVAPCLTPLLPLWPPALPCPPPACVAPRRPARVSLASARCACQLAPLLLCCPPACPPARLPACLPVKPGLCLPGPPALHSTLGYLPACLPSATNTPWQTRW